MSEDLLKLPSELRSGLIEQLNKRVAPYRRGTIFIGWILLGYSVGGGLLLTGLAIVAGLMVSYWVSVALVILYFLGLAGLIVFSNKRGKMYEKRMLFNTGLVVHNLNWNPGEVF